MVVRGINWMDARESLRVAVKQARHFADDVHKQQHFGE